MIIFQIVSVVLWLVIVPLLIGINFYTEKITRISNYILIYIWGIIAMFSLFEIITVPLTFLNQSLSMVTVIWSAGILLLCVRGMMKGRGRLIQGLPVLKSIRKRKGIEYLALGTILYQAVYVVCSTHIDNDDAWYVGTAVASYFTDTINKIYPYTGAIMEQFPSDYTLSPFPVFFAMLSKLTFIHPAVLMHTVIPMFFILMSYGIYYLTAKKLLMGKEEFIGWFMLFFSIFHIFGDFSSRSVSSFMLVRVWQGKAVLCSILIPLAVYFFSCCAEEGGKKYWLGEFLTVLSATMVSSMGVFLMPVLLGALSATDLIMRRSLKNSVRAAICIIPCIVQFGIFYIFLR